MSDYQEERSRCVQRSIKKHGGNYESAMEECKNHRDYNLLSWDGNGRTLENKLIESTAKWAGFKGKGAKRVVELTKSFIGDTVLREGNVSLDFGPRRVQLTPRTYLMEVKSQTFDKLCRKLLNKVIQSGGYKSNIYKTVSDKDLELTSAKKNIIDRQTLISLSYLPYKKRRVACKKLSDALAMHQYSEDMGKTLDFISSKMSSNVHLPVKRKIEVDRKRRAFKDQVELTLALEDQNNTPLNKVLFQINKEGQKYIGLASKREFDSETEAYHSSRIDSLFMDCADGLGCE